MDETLVNRTEQYITQLFREKAGTALPYHTLVHTQEVVQAADLLATHYQLAPTDHLAVLTAAWFHDIGYLTTVPSKHEEEGAGMAADFLTGQGISPAIIAQVRQCILATKMPQNPHTLPEQILCDADLFHLGSESFKAKTKLLRQEREQLTGQSISGSDWRQGNIRLLQSHQYFTDYGRALRQQGQADNLRRLLEKQAEKNPPIPDAHPTARELLPVSGSAKRKNDKEPKSRYGRGVETMFRTTSINHVHLSEMADNKANTMITVNSILVSLLVSVLFSRLEAHKELLIPTGMLVLTALVTIIFSIRITRPSVNEGTFSAEDIRQHKVNLLFFGNFYRMDLHDYETGVSELIQDEEYLYTSLTRDIYYMGVVLGRKYRLLRIAYNIFMFGFTASVIGFIIAGILYR